VKCQFAVPEVKGQGHRTYKPPKSGVIFTYWRQHWWIKHSRRRLHTRPTPLLGLVYCRRLRQQDGWRHRMTSRGHSFVVTVTIDHIISIYRLQCRIYHLQLSAREGTAPATGRTTTINSLRYTIGGPKTAPLTSSREISAKRWPITVKCGVMLAATQLFQLKSTQLHGLSQKNFSSTGIYFMLHLRDAGTNSKRCHSLRWHIAKGQESGPPGIPIREFQFPSGNSREFPGIWLS